MNHPAARKLIVPLALALASAAVGADPMVYVVNLAQQFGTVNLTSGAFQPIGPGTPEGESGLAVGPSGSLLTLTFSGNLDAIDPVTGLTTVLGATGLGGQANTLAGHAGQIYATDLANNLYKLNTSTGAATLIGPMGIPAMPGYPFSTNPDGTTNLLDQALFSHGGNLYATYDVFRLGADGFSTGFTIEPKLYVIDTTTGFGTLLSSTAPQVLAAADVGGGVYAFQGAFNAAHPFMGAVSASTLNLASGNAAYLTAVDSSAIFGAVEVPAVPEPASMALWCLGLAAMAFQKRVRTGRSKN